MCWWWSVHHPTRTWRNCVLIQQKSSLESSITNWRRTPGPYKVTEVQWHTVIINEDGSLDRVTIDKVTPVQKSTGDGKQATNSWVARTYHINTRQHWERRQWGRQCQKGREIRGNPPLASCSKTAKDVRRRVLVWVWPARQHTEISCPHTAAFHW